MSNQACPVNYKRVNVYLIKFYSTIVAALLMMYLLAGWRIPIYVLAADFVVRVFLGIRFSPFCKVLGVVLNYLQVKPREIDASTKEFAARVGMLFSLSVALLTWFGAMKAAQWVAVVFLLAVLSEVMLDFCLACWMESIWKKYVYKRKTPEGDFFRKA